jgi:hypothetical protein
MGNVDNSSREYLAMKSLNTLHTTSSLFRLLTLVLVCILIVLAIGVAQPIVWPSGSFLLSAVPIWWLYMIYMENRNVG